MVIVNINIDLNNYPFIYFKTKKYLFIRPNHYSYHPHKTYFSV